MGPTRLALTLTCLQLTSQIFAAPSPTNSSKPAPLSVPCSQVWDGSDGKWSSFQLSLSGPARQQTIRVFPSTSLYQIWAVPPTGCPDGWVGGESVCEEQRGKFYNVNASATWQQKSVYAVDNMHLASAYGISDLAIDFGWETVAVGYPGSGNNALDHTLVGQMGAYKLSTLGFLGLDPKPTNFTDLQSFSGPQESYMQKLKDNKTIPSLSFGYTAGQHYHDPPLFGSLVLGGADLARFSEPSGAIFPFYEDVETPLRVPLSAVTPILGAEDSKALSNTYRMDNTVLIDSTRPFIYLPRELAMHIAETFGLEYDSNEQYLVANQTTYNRLRDSNASLAFDIRAANPDKTITITLPFGAIVQPLKYPYVTEDTFYIPIRPATDPNQYVLGRTFLQEAYLKADYEAQKFGLYPAIAPRGQKEELVPITLGANTRDGWTLPISKATLGGIIGGLGALILILLLILLGLRMAKKRQQKIAEESDRHISLKLEPYDISSPSTLSPDTPSTIKALELDSEYIHESDAIPKMPSAIYISELRNSIASPITNELDSSEYTGFSQHRSVDSDKEPMIKVYYEMDATPPTSAENSPSSTMSNSTTLVGSNLRTIDDLLSPIPQTPVEYYDRSGGRGAHGPIRAGDRSSIPETPAEFYGRVAQLPLARGDPRRWGDRPTSIEAAAVGAIVAGAPVGQPRVTLTPATPASPTEREVERSRWLRGHSGRRKTRDMEP